MAVGLKNKIVITRFSVDDGHKLDTKTAQILSAYGFTGIFYIPSMSRLLTDSEIIKIAEKHEIGGHTKDHLKLTYLPVEIQIQQVKDGKEQIESIIQKKITKFAYPRGWFSPTTKSIVRKAGFEEARTMKLGALDISDYDRYELPATAHLRPRAEYGWNVVGKIEELYLRATKEENGYFNLVVHSWELEKYHLWDNFEEILRFIYEDTNTKLQKK